MAYQPNPFVDPNQRGFQLPIGCKDLHDVLARVPRRRLGVSSLVESGTLGTLRSYIDRFYEAKSKRVTLVILNVETGALLIVSCKEGGFNLNLLVHKGSAFLEEAILEIFGEAALETTSTPDEELQSTHIPLPDSWEDAAQRIIDLLIRGYGLPEQARLLFHYQEEKDRN